MPKVFQRLLKASPEAFRGWLLRHAIEAAEESEKFRFGQPTMFGSLQNLVHAGFVPASIVDVGANVGDWARMAHQIFPHSSIHMVEGQPSLEPRLKGVGFPYTITLVGPQNTPAAPFYLSGTGSSILEELTGFSDERIELPMQKLDDLAAIQSMPGPLLLKLDVQGYELEVLAGAIQTLRKTEVILSEVSLLEYNKGSPLMHEVIGRLAQLDFVPYDICGGLRRSSDMALFQTDIIFTRRDSHLRDRKTFWSAETK